MSDEQVKLIFPKGMESVDRGTKHGLYRDDKMVFLEKESGNVKEVGPNAMVSGKSKGRGPGGIPYQIDVQDDLTVRFRVYNSTNPVRVGTRTTTHSENGIKIDQYDSQTKCSIGGSGGEADFHFIISLPEDPSKGDKDEDSRSGGFDGTPFESRSSEEDEEKTDDGRVIKTEMLERVTTALEEVHREHGGQQDFPTVDDFFNKLGQEGLLRNPEANIIYIDDGVRYTVQDIYDGIEVLQNQKQKSVPVKEAHKVSTLGIWRGGVKNRITSEGNLRSDVGELFLWNDSSNALIGEAASQSRRERVDTLVR